MLAPNPSHLEFVNPVVEGMARASQDHASQPGPPPQDRNRALAILLHGDAAFPGQGIVAETLNFSGLPGYSTGGTIHIIVNNQVGFTTDIRDSRSTLYAGDLAKGFEIPVVHVNADDPVSCLSAARLAVAYRQRFGKDFLIDLVGYRRWGHNEGDEPTFTQPRMYATVTQHPTVRQRFGRFLGGDDALRDQLLGEALAHGRMLCDGGVHPRLGEGRLVALVVAPAAVADEVDQEVLAELAAGRRSPAAPRRGRRRDRRR